MTTIAAFDSLGREQDTTKGHSMGERLTSANGFREVTRWPPAQSASDKFASVKRAMAALPRAEREVLMLWNSGMDYRGIAERTHQSSDAVGMLLTQARKRLVMAYDVLAVGAKGPTPQPW